MSWIRFVAFWRVHYLEIDSHGVNYIARYPLMHRHDGIGEYIWIEFAHMVVRTIAVGVNEGSV